MSVRRRAQGQCGWTKRMGATLTAVSLLIPWLPNTSLRAAPLTCSAQPVWATYFTRATPNTTGADPSGNSSSPVISRDGFKIAFSSSASDLVTGDTNGVDDIFQFDRGSHAIKRLTAGSSWESNGTSRFPALSVDGQFTAYLSAGDNLVTGDTNGVNDLFVYDLNGITTRQSVSSTGSEADGAYSLAGPSLSETGRSMAFVSSATNLVTGDTNGKVDVFLRDRTNGTTTLISNSPTATPADGDSTAASISPEGDFVAYQSGATNLVTGDTNGKTDIFLYNAAAGTTTRISLDALGHEADGDSSIAPVGAVSTHGNFVVFTSKATNLVAGDTNGASDVFLYNRQNGSINRISLSDRGQQANGDSWDAKITKNGAYVVFTSKADNLIPGVRPGTTNVYRYDIQGHSVALVNATRFGTAGNADAISPSISDNGQYVAFATAATDLVQNKTTGVTEILVRDMMSPSFPLGLTSAIATGSTIALTYSRTLQQTSVPCPSDFVVTVGSTPQPVTGVQVFANTVKLTIGRGISPSDTVTLDYTPGTNPIQDTLLIAAQPFTAQSVTNQTRTAGLRSGVVTGASLVMTFDSDLDTTSVPAKTDFNVTEDGTPVSISTVSMDSRHVRLTLSAPITPGSFVMVAYTAGTAPLQTRAGGLVASFAGEAVDNTTVSLALDTVTGSNSKITLNFNQLLDSGSVPATTDFSVNVTSPTAAPFHPSAVSVAFKTVTLTLSRVLQEGEVVTLDYTPGTKPIQTPTWSPAASFTAITVPNSSVAPKISGLTVDAARLHFIVSRRLDPTSVPSGNDFSVKVNGAAVNPTGVAIDSIHVTLTLPSPVKPGDTVTLDYTPGTKPLQDGMGSQVLPTSLPVTNVTPSPLIRSASVTADAMLLNFTRPLDPTKVPAAGAFTVKVNGSALPASGVAAVTVADRTVKLTLAQAVLAGDKVTVDYSGSSAIQDLAGSPSPGFTGQAVVNLTIAPVPGQPRVTASQLILPFNRSLDTSSAPPASAFTVSVNGTPQAPSGVSLSGNSVTLTVSPAAHAGDTVLVSYNPTGVTTPLRDTAHNQVAAISSLQVGNFTNPIFQSATIQGAQLTLNYNATLSSTSVPALTDFTVRVSGSPVGVAKVTISGRAAVLTLNAAAKPGDSVTVGYTRGTTPIADQAGNPGQNLTARAVTNLTIAPTLVGATVNTKTLTINFNRTLDSTSKPSPSDFTVTVTSGGTPSTMTVSSLTVSGVRVTLTLAAAVKKGDSVKLTYISGTNPLQDAQKSPVGPIVGYTVTNQTAK